MRTPMTVLAAGLALAACASAPYPPGPPPPPTSADGNDCVVIAAVAREHYRFNTTDNRPPPLKFEDGYNPRCDWSRYGLAFEPFDQARAERQGRIQWVSFDRPVYDGGGATIETGILHGPLAGMGSTCRLRSGFAGWTVQDCRGTWIS